MLNKTNQEISFINGYMRRINNQMNRKILIKNIERSDYNEVLLLLWKTAY